MHDIPEKACTRTFVKSIEMQSSAVVKSVKPSKPVRVVFKECESCQRPRLAPNSKYATCYDCSQKKRETLKECAKCGKRKIDPETVYTVCFTCSKEEMYRACKSCGRLNVRKETKFELCWTCAHPELTPGDAEK